MKSPLSLCRFCTILALLLVTGCGMTQQVQSDKIKANLGEASRQLQIGNTSAAKVWIDRAIAVRPNDPAVYLEISQLLSEESDDTTLVSYLQQAQRKFSKNDQLLYILEQAQGRLGDTTGQKATASALASLLETQAGKPGVILDAARLTEMGQAYFDAGDSVNGAKKFQQVIKTFPLDPQKYNAMNALAYAYAVTNDKTHLPEALTLALEAYQNAQKLNQQGKVSDESLGAVQDTVGWVQYRLGNYPAAVSNLQQAMNLIPQLAETRYHLGMAYQADHQIEAARGELKRALLLSPAYDAPKRALAVLPPVNKSTPAS